MASPYLAAGRAVAPARRTGNKPHAGLVVTHVSNEQPSPQNTDVLVLAGGCFWCLDAWYRTVRGVLTVESGYTGGHTEHPDYYSVCEGTTGHAEAVAVVYDREQIGAETILDMFFVMHDPTTLNRQGYDVGTQYRSALFPRSDEQLGLMQEAIERNQANWAQPIVTSLEPLTNWTAAEPEHQDYYAKHPEAGYCQVIINPKLSKARQYFASWQVPA